MRWQTFDRDSHDFNVDEEGKREKRHSLFHRPDGLGRRLRRRHDNQHLRLARFRNVLRSLTSTLRRLTSSTRRDGPITASGATNCATRAGSSKASMRTTGVYYFTNEINYHERRSLLTDVIAASGLSLPPGTDVSQSGGGNYDIETLGLFLSLDYDLTSKLTLTAGTRYTREKREAEIALIATTPPPASLAPSCNIVEGPACEFDFTGEETWHSWSPKLGAAYYISGEANVYGHWTRGFRSGGYNLRNSLPVQVEPQGPYYDEEKIDSFEAGFKVSKDRGRLYGAVFYNLIDDVQREINFPIPGSSVVAQVIRNTADVKALGFEFDGLFAVTENLLLLGSVGYVDPEYTKVKYDLNRDDVVDGTDEALELPRAAKWTYSVGLTHDTGAASWGRMTSRISYSYRDKSYFTDDNLGYILEQNILDAGVDIRPSNGRFSIGLYGKNLLNEVKHGGDTLLPPVRSASVGSTRRRHVLAAFQGQNFRRAGNLPAQKLTEPKTSPGCS